MSLTKEQAGELLKHVQTVVFDPSGSALIMICLKHPESEIRHSWDETYHMVNGYPDGAAIKTRDCYECIQCEIERNASVSVEMMPLSRSRM